MRGRRTPRPMGAGPEVARLQLAGVQYVVLREDVFRRLCRAEQAPGAADEGDIADLVPAVADDASIGRRVRERRLLSGLTQVELARQAGIRVETLNRIERGRTTPDFATLRKVATALKAAART